MSDELLPVGQLSNKKRLVETATTAVVAELVATLAQASTAKIGALQASTEIIGYVKIDQTTPGASNAVTPVSTGGTAIKLSASGWQIAALGGGLAALPTPMPTRSPGSGIMLKMKPICTFAVNVTTAIHGIARATIIV